MSSIGYTNLLNTNSGSISVLTSTTAIAPTSGGNAFKVATTSAINTTGASLIVVAVSDNILASTPSLVDNAGNTWTLVRTQTDTTKNRLKVYICAAPITSVTHTFTYSVTTNGYPTVMVLALAGTRTSGVLDQQNGNTVAGATTSASPGSITPTLSNEIVITAVSAGGQSGQTSAPTIASGYTRSNHYDWVANYKSAMAYLIQSSPSATNPTWTFNGTDTAAVIILSFKAT